MSRPDLIWWDSESNLGRGWKSEYASEEQNLGQKIKCLCPVRDVIKTDYCLTNSTDCQAFREWTDKGYYGVFAKDGNFTGIDSKSNLVGFRLKAI